MEFSSRTCDFGFVLQGDEQRVCIENETWSGELPTCFRKFKFCSYYPIPDIPLPFLVAIVCRDKMSWFAQPYQWYHWHSRQQPGRLSSLPVQSRPVPQWKLSSNLQCRWNLEWGSTNMHRWILSNTHNNNLLNIVFFPACNLQNFYARYWLHQRMARYLSMVRQLTPLQPTFVRRDSFLNC